MIEKINRYGVDMSRSDAYWLDCTEYNKRYRLKRAYQECGCFIDEDCCCEEEIDGEGEGLFEPQSNRRLLLTLRR